MYFIDPHTHLDDLSYIDLEKMYLSGVRKLISPSQLCTAKPLSNDTIIEVWDYLLEVQFNRAKNAMIEPYAMIGISMVSTPKNDPTDLYKKLKEYIKMDKVVAIGEIGFEPMSRTCDDLAIQEKYVKKQIEICKGEDIRINFHTPNPPEVKKQYTKRLIEICKENEIDFSNIIFDHCSGANLSMVLDAGAWAAITVQPWRNITPEIAANLVSEYGSNKIMVDSDCSASYSDSLSVAKTAMELKRTNVPENDIEKVCSLNAQDAYKI